MIRFLTIAAILAGTCSAQELNFNPNLFDRLGVGTQGVPAEYGYGSYGQNGYQTGSPFGLGIDDFLRSYRLRPDVLLEQSQMSTRQAAELHNNALRYENDLRTRLGAEEQRRRQIDAASRAIARVVNGSPQQRPGSALPMLRDRAYLVVRTHCFECHGNGASQGGYTLDSFATMDCTQLQGVLNSVVRQDTPRAPRMPLNRDPLSEGEIKAIECYAKAVCEGGETAPPTPIPPSTPPVNPPPTDGGLTEDGVRAIVLAEINKAENRITVNVVNELKPSIEKINNDLKIIIEGATQPPVKPDPGNGGKSPEIYFDLKPRN